MEAQTLAIAVKAAREEARKIIPERGPIGPRGKDGKDGADGKNGANGKDGLNGQDGTNGKDGKQGADGKDGQDANRWHLVEGQPNDNFGEDDDFALDGVSSNVWHKEEGEWEFVLHLKAEVPMLQPPRAYSETQIRELASPKDRIIVVDQDYNFDLSLYDVVKVRGAAVITIPAPTQENKGCTIEVKIQTNERVEIKPQSGTIEDEACRIVRHRKYWNFRLLSDGTEWTEM